MCIATVHATCSLGTSRRLMHFVCYRYRAEPEMEKKEFADDDEEEEEA